MSDTSENAAFWLPTHFLTDDDLSINTKPTTRLHQPDPFFSPPDSFSFLDSPVSSTDHPYKPDNNDEDEELPAELTRYLARSSLNHSQGWGYSTSPQSTLPESGPWSSNRSWFSNNSSPTGPSRVPSPPVTTANKQNDATSELFYEAAAAHLAPLKLNSLSSHHNASPYSHLQVGRHGSSVWEQGRAERVDCYYFRHQKSHYQQHRSYGSGVSGWCAHRAGQGCTQRRTQGMTAVFLDGSGSVGGGGVKKQSSGTGVFIPRRADSGTHHTVPATNNHKKSSGCSTVWLPARVVQALNLDVEEMKNGGANYNNTPKQVLTDHEITVARRNTVMNMQRRNGVGAGGAKATMVGHHVVELPNDWAY